jgi:hypothetical protein
MVPSGLGGLAPDFGARSCPPPALGVALAVSPHIGLLAGATPPAD